MADKVPDLTVDEIVRRIKEEAAQRNKRGVNGSADFNKFHSEFANNLKEFLYPVETLEMTAFWSAPSLKVKSTYHVNEFLKFHDKEFVQVAYQHLLGRHPDQKGLDHYLNELHHFRLSKIEILGRLRFSSEGRKGGVRINGLGFPFFLHSSFHIPIMAQVVCFFSQLISFFRPSVYRKFLETNNQLRFGGYAAAHKETMLGVAEKLNEIINLYNNLNLNQIADKLDELQQRLEKKAEASASVIQDLEKYKSETDELVKTLDSLNSRINQKAENKDVSFQLSALRRNISGQERRLRKLLQEARKRLPAEMDKSQLERLSSEGDHLLDALYVSFEDRFRGSKEEIKRRQELYLAYIADTLKDKAVSSVLDLGCGRGEWLELLKENSYPAMGVDNNQVMVEDCRHADLDVVESDAIEYLTGINANSLGAVTVFHLLEHLSLEDMVQVLDESLRVLITGGMVVLETPNPRNLFVGAGDFYRDPSHKNPLFPESLAFICEQRGFSDVAAYFFESSNGKEVLISSSDYPFNQLEDYLNVSRDFVVIGYKA